MQRHLHVGFLVAIAATGMGVGYWFGARSTRDTTLRKTDVNAAAPRHDSAPESLRPPPHGQPPPPSPIETAIRQDIERASVIGCENADTYLDSLEAQARRQGAVTAREVEPGVAMVGQHCDDPEKGAQFAARMLRVQQELTGTQPEPAPAPDRLEIRKQLDTWMSQIQQSKDEAQKRESIRKYIEAALGLDTEERVQVLADLNAVAGRAPPPADPSRVDTLWKAIQEAAESKRPPLVRDYIAAILQLPDEERRERMAEVTRRYGTRPTP